MRRITCTVSDPQITDDGPSSDSFAAGEGNAFTVRCDTEEDLLKALDAAKAHKGLAFIELTIDKDDCSKQLLEWGSRVSAANGRAFVEL